MIPHNMTLFKFICVQYQFHRQTLPIMKIDQGQIQFRDCFNRNGTEARSQRPLPSLYFSCRSKKQDGRPRFWLVETFSTSPLKPLNWFQRNLTGSKISTSSTKCVCFEPISKKKGLPWSIPLKGGTLYSGARYVALWASCVVNKPSPNSAHLTLTHSYHFSLYTSYHFPFISKHKINWYVIL